MNLSEALTAALPELPQLKKQKGPPLLDPDIIVREQIEDGEPVMMCYKRRTSNLYRFSPIQWELLQLFDGQRTYEQISEDFVAMGGFAASADELQQFAQGLDESDFWYKSPQERNAALHHRCQEDRRQHIQKKSKYGDVAHMQFSAWDPNEFLTAWYYAIRFAYTRWFTLLTLALFAFTAYVFVADWGQIGRDTLLYYNFTQKSASDLVEFWLLFLVLGFFHESAHGLTCKHFGGDVHSMGFHLIYLTPAFFIDVSEVFVFGGRWQRVLTILAGIWVELIFCGLATVVYWATAPGTFVHDFSYKVMLITGVAVIVVNANPLIKLDGYFIFGEILSIAEIKEKSTAYVSQWVRKNIWRLPVEVDYVPRRRRVLFITYAVLSGAYSYMLLITVTKFAYHVFLSYNPEWAFIPALGVAWLIFKSRIKTLVRFMRSVYLDKKERVARWFTPPRRIAAGLAAAVLLFTPLFTEHVEARFSLEPQHFAVVRSPLNATVTQVMVDEGQRVRAGERLLVMRDHELESEAAAAGNQLLRANADSVTAQLRYASVGAAQAQQVRAIDTARAMEAKVAALTVRSPIDGTVTSARPQDLQHVRVDAGADLLEISDTSRLRARLYIPEFEVRRVHPGQPVAMLLDSSFHTAHGTVVQVQSQATEIAEGLIHKEDYRGLQPPNYYVADVDLTGSTDAELRQGASGTAKVVLHRRSLAQMVWTELRDFTGRKIW